MQVVCLQGHIYTGIVQRFRVNENALIHFENLFMIYEKDGHIIFCDPLLNGLLFVCVSIIITPCSNAAATPVRNVP